MRDVLLTIYRRLVWGPNSSFHNASRLWLYLGFLAAVLMLACALKHRSA